MQQFFRKIASRALITANYFAAFFFLLSCFTPYLDPRRWWFTGFMGLIFPYLLVTILFFLLFWLFVKPRRSLVSAVCLLIGVPAVNVLIPWNFPADFTYQKKGETLRVMNWNVRRFTPFNSYTFNPSDKDNKRVILEEIRRHNPDILCLQEFFSADDNGNMNNIRLLKEQFGFTHYVFSRDNQIQAKIFGGTAIFSRYPIIGSSVIRYPAGMAKSVESVISADISFNGDTMRIYNMHLQSFGFGLRDYNSFGKIKNQQDTGLHASKNLFRKMKQTFYFHSLQADFVKAQINSSPYPVIACGDLNDVPNSYAYYKISDDMTDCFLEKGTGFGKTFTSPTSRLLGSLPTLRIDYIFAGPVFETTQFTRMYRKLSDHSALITDLELIKK